MKNIPVPPTDPTILIASKTIETLCDKNKRERLMDEIMDTSMKFSSDGNEFIPECTNFIFMPIGMAVGFLKGIFK